MKKKLRVAAVVTAVCLAVLLAACGSQEGKTETGNGNGGEAVVIASGQSLEIPAAEVTENASFYPVEVDGTRMEVIAVRDSQGEIRTAFNTCQVCYSSGRGYYEQSGKDLVCQNCGSHFSMDQVEIESGGCNPWPIFQENKTVTDDTVSISYEFLREASAIFANWRTDY